MLFFLPQIRTKRLKQSVFVVLLYSIYYVYLTILVSQVYQNRESSFIFDYNCILLNIILYSNVLEIR